MSGRAPRRDGRRNAARLARYLESKCLICMDGHEPYPSTRLPCCRQYAHEGCVRSCFIHATGSLALKHRCPHCRAALVPVNAGEAAPEVSNGSHLFVFRYVRYDLEEVLHERWLNPAPIPPPPPGWAQHRRNGNAR